jgi:hypothetical protein
MAASRCWPRGNPNGKTLAIEHTLIEPFVKDKEDFAFFAQAFLKIEDDESLVVPDRRIEVCVPVGTLQGRRRAATREAMVNVVHQWIKNNRLNLQDGEHQYPCPMAGIPGTTNFEITLTIIFNTLKGPGQFNIRRQQIGNDFGDVVEKALRKKLPKLTSQKADKRVLILEREHMNLVPEQMLGEIRRQAPAFPQLSAVDEIWILETVGYKPGGHFLFELNDENNMRLATLTFNGGTWTSRRNPDL